MEAVKTIALEKAIKTLEAVGCAFCVIDSNGKKYGHLEVVQTKTRTRSQNKLPRGTVIGYLKPLIGNLQPGEVGAVNCSKFGKTPTGKYISSAAIKWWGKGNATVTYVKENDEVQVLRVA